ncbi:lysylphosphatidylglycerol synthase transmembrane domain-containing protein [Caproicibacter sp.]|uniref:lysylphosphatidylglycerol synthase transmembrane domain-containing protein n=1 Tax=Caproicibacter sp. TaxID=2814884 RepID=UPI0039890805
MPSERLVAENTKRRKIFQAALFSLTLGMLVYFCVSGNNLAVLIQSLPNISFFWMLCAAASVFLNWMMDSLIIHTLIFHTSGGRYGFGSAFRVTMVGQYFNSITPYALAGQPMQFLALTGQGISTGVAVSTLVKKFLTYQTSLTVYSLLVILVKYQFFQSRIQGFMALAFVGFLYQAAVVVALVLFSYSPGFTTKLIRGAVWVLTRVHLVKKPQETREKVKGQLEFFLENNRALQGKRSLGVKIYGFTVIQLTALFLVPFFIYKAFHNPGAPVIDMISAQSFVTMISGYTPLPGAAGAAEGSFLVIFQMFFAPGIIQQAMLLWRLLAYYSCIVVGAFFAVPERRRAGMKAARAADAAEQPAPEAGQAANSGGIKHE